ncbi:MAG: AAA family ATPase [Alphaproteobacteria bacterium]|nr:AAA family ATPase [Alphaproteobacteria bacterium]
MSDAPTRLNLIQRAMQQASSKRIEPARVEAPIEAKPADLRSERSERVERVERQEYVAPRPPSTESSPVRLKLAKLRGSRMVTPENKMSVTYNEFRSIKRKLLPMTRDPDTHATTRNIVMITSALSGEGKTFTALNLAIGLAAERNLDVVLVDGDVVRASIGEYFEGASGQQGLIELLTGARQSLDEVVHPCTEIPNLHVLFSGKRDEASPELLASARMGEICGALSRRYRESVVVIDAPPVLATAEPTALASHVNHILMVVAAGQAGREHLEQALNGIATCPSISLIFNKSPEWLRPTPYSYYYNYGKG